VRGVELPPRGSVRSCVMEEMVHRERIRSWKSLLVELNTLTAHISKDPELLSKVGEEAADYYSMVVHGSGAYDLNRRLTGNSRAIKGDTVKEDLKILKMLDGLPDELQ